LAFFELSLWPVDRYPAAAMSVIGSPVSLALAASKPAAHQEPHSSPVSRPAPGSMQRARTGNPLASKPATIAGIVAMGMVLLACACGAAENPSPALLKDYAETRAFAINQRIGHGVNIGGALDTPQKEGEWGITLQDEYFQVIKDAGFNSIRIPVRWNAHAAPEPPYTIDPDFLKRIDWAITNCLSRNLSAVLTTHHYDELYSDPAGQKDRFVAIWRQIAQRYKDCPNTLVFDPLMEAQDKLDAGKWNSLLNETIATIRRSNPRRTIVICAAGLSCIDNLHLLELPGDDRNIIVSIFYYAPQEFTQQGATWLPQAKAWLGTKWTGSAVEKQRIAEDFDIAAGWAKKNNRPIYLNEFGTYEKADMESRVRWTRCVAEAAAQRGFSLAYWEFCSSFGLYDLQTKSWRKELLAAVVPPPASAPARNDAEGSNPPEK
jgi:endoglucanase